MTVIAMRSAGRGVGSDSAAKDNELCRFNLDGGQKIQRCPDVFVDDNGKVGIGTDSPTPKIDVNGYGAARTCSGEFLFGLKADNSGITGMEYKNANAAGDVRIVLVDTDDNYMAFSMPGLTRSATILGVDVTTAAFLFTLGDRGLALGTYSGYPITLSTSNTARIVISVGGNVTHTTGGPRHIFHNNTEEDIDGGGESHLIFSREQSGGGSSYCAKIAGFHDGSGNDENGALAFYTNDGNDTTAPTGRMYINSAGSIGIGNTFTTPKASGLEVYRDIDAPSDLGNFEDYQLIVRGGGTTGDSAGMLFSTSADTYGGSAIVHYDTGSGGQGDLVFYIKQGTTAIPPVECMRMYRDGNIGIGEIAPETLLEMTSTSPILTFHNSTEENIEGGRECIWRAKGEKQDGTEHTLGEMQFSHDGAGDDYKADFILSINKSDGAADNLTEALRIDSALLAIFADDVDIVGDLTAGTIQSDNGFTGSFTNGDGDTVTVVGGIITDVS